MRHSKSNVIKRLSFLGRTLSVNILLLLLSFSLIAFVLPLTGCDKSLRISTSQAQLFKNAAEATLKRKGALAVEINNAGPQPQATDKIKAILLSNLIEAAKDTAATKAAFEGTTKNHRLLEASARLFGDISSSYLDYKEPVRRLNVDTVESTIDGLNKLYENNSAAIGFVGEAETLEYMIVVASVPAKAKVSYRRPLATSYQQGGETNVTLRGKDITRAKWEVRVELNGKSVDQKCEYYQPICCLTFDLVK
jgi:hypothetical protein